jgi:hypothetical protein
VGVAGAFVGCGGAVAAEHRAVAPACDPHQVQDAGRTRAERPELSTHCCGDSQPRRRRQGGRDDHGSAVIRRVV